MKYIKKFEISNYQITTNTDLRYVIVVKIDNNLYVKCNKTGENTNFDIISSITHISQVITYFPNDINFEMKKYENMPDKYEFDVMTIDEIEMLINANKYNL